MAWERRGRYPGAPGQLVKGWAPRCPDFSTHVATGPAWRRGQPLLRRQRPRRTVHALLRIPPHQQHLRLDPTLGQRHQVQRHRPTRAAPLHRAPDLRPGTDPVPNPPRTAKTVLGHFASRAGFGAAVATSPSRAETMKSAAILHPRSADKPACRLPENSPAPSRPAGCPLAIRLISVLMSPGCGGSGKSKNLRQPQIPNKAKK